MNFGDALALLKQGKYLARDGWNGKGQYIFLIGQDSLHEMWTYTNGKNDNTPLLPFLAMVTVDSKVAPWLASQTDLLSEDWKNFGDLNAVGV